MIVWIDSEDGTRGGSIYLKRGHQAALGKGELSTYKRIDSIGRRIGVILSSWYSGGEIRGTVPREIPTLIWCRHKRGYIQSPPEQWSMISRIAMKVFLRIGGSTAACVSVTTRDSAERLGLGSLAVEYVRLDTHQDNRCTLRTDKEDRKTVFIVMDNGSIDKGYLRHLSIIDAIGCRHRVSVEVYGAGERMSYGCESNVRYNGFRTRPFEDAKRKNYGDYLFYLGCSRYEGLHMAVVEAAMFGIPSVLSDIPAHRELQDIAGERLIMGKCAADSIKMLESILSEGSYALKSAQCSQLANKFAGKDCQHGEVC